MKERARMSGLVGIEPMLVVMSTIAIHGCAGPDGARGLDEAAQMGSHHHGNAVEGSRGALESSWIPCSSEWEYCEFTGTKRVRYGAEGHWLYESFTDGTPCTNDAFGSDPVVGVTKACAYESVSADPPPPPPSGSGPYIDLTKIPKGNPGIAQREFNSAPGPFAPSDIGEVRFVCQYSHMNMDDALVYPGQPGAAHLHAYFGNTLADAFSTASSLATTGNSTCYGGIVNRSAYWVPALIDANGVPQRAVQGNFYYKTGYDLPPASIQSFPSGLRMIAGDAKATGPQPGHVGQFGCIGSGSWTCPAGTENMPYWCGSIPNCGQGNRIVQYVGFPQCWKGPQGAEQNLDSPDHKGHMAYPVGGACPSTHPIAIPHVEYLLEYEQNTPNTDGWRLSSDMYDSSLPGGFSAHGDYFSAWEQDILDTFVRECDQKSLNCEDGPIGDGRGLTNRLTWAPFPD
jgi:hypothetical protein